LLVLFHLCGVPSGRKPERRFPEKILLKQNVSAPIDPVWSDGAMCAH